MISVNAAASKFWSWRECDKCSILFLGERLQLADNFLVSLLQFVHFGFNIQSRLLFFFQLSLECRNLRLARHFSICAWLSKSIRN